MKKLKTKWFNKWAKKQKLSNEKLLLAIADIQNNLSSVNLGGGLYKVRVSSEGNGKSSAYRTIVVYRENDRAVMVYGFMKNEQENISIVRLKNLKILAKDILSLDDKLLWALINDGIFVQIGEKDEK